MTLKNEELLSRYFERKMTSGEEQNFLISVAANDELRLAFRSQLELMRAVSNDKDGIRSAAEVRMRTLAALGLTTLAADEFLEHELLNRPAKQAASEAVTSEVKREVVVQAASAPSGFMGFISSPLMTIGGGLLVGFLAAVAIFSNPEPEISTPAQQQIQTPATQIQTQPGSEISTPRSQPGITPQNGAKTPVVASRPSTSAKPNISASRKPASETIAPNSDLNLEANGTKEQPVIDRQGAGSMSVKAPKINKPSDSTAKQ
jgi:hypothetical protein